MDDKDLLVRPEDAPHDVIDSPGIQKIVSEEFWQMLLFNFAIGALPGTEPAFNVEGTRALIRMRD